MTKEKATIMVTGNADGGTIENQETSHEDANTLPETVKKKKLSGTNAAQLVSHGINNVISVFVSTFLVSYIYSISENYLANIGLFYVFNYLTMAVVYLAVSAVIDRTNRVLFYRIAMMIRASFIIMVIFVGKQLAGLVILAGVLHGFSEACYWTSYNIMKNELVRKSSVKLYSTLQTIIERTVYIIIPITLGKIIDAESFKLSAIIVAVLVAIEFISSFFIKSHRPENSKFDLKGFFNDVKNLGEKGKLVKQGLLTSFLYGFYNSISIVNTVLIMLAYNSNFSLGILTGVFSAMAIIYLIIISKCTKPGKRNTMFIVSAILPLITAIMLAIDINKWFIALFTMVYTVCHMSFVQPFDVGRNVVIKKLNMYDNIAEFQALVEFVMEMGRVISFGLMVIFGAVGLHYGTDGLVLATKIYSVLAVAMLIAINIAVMSFEKNLCKYEML